MHPRAPCSFVAMVSRKKAKGKARRAAKEAKATEEDFQEEGQEHKALEAQMQRLTMDDLLRESDAVQKCQHGFEFEGHEQRLCIEFVNEFHRGYSLSFRAGDSDIGSSLIGAMNATMEKFASMWNDVEKMKGVLSFLLASGAQNILQGNDSAARLEASFACFFEQYVQVELKRTHPQIDCLRIAELQWADMNTLVNYFRKRIPCKCLDKRYKEVKNGTQYHIYFRSESKLWRLIQNSVFSGG